MVATIPCCFHFLRHRRQHHSLTIILEHSCVHQALAMLAYLSRLDSNYSNQDSLISLVAKASKSHYFARFA